MNNLIAATILGMPSMVDFWLVVLIGYLLPVFKFVFEGVVAVISFPFRLLSRLFLDKK